MDDDWASEGEEEGLGDLSDIPDIDIPPQQRQNPGPPHKSQLPPTAVRPPPRQNAWTKPIQSQQVRSAAQQPQQPRGHHRRQNSFPSSFASKSDRFDSDPQRLERRTSNVPTTNLYVANLPYETHEQAIGDFFNVNTIDVFGIRIMRHSDTGKIKAALVTIPTDHVPRALATDGKLFGGRAMHVKVDGTDGKRGGRDKDRGERSHGKNPAFASFGTRAPPNGSSRPGSAWNDRGPGLSFDSQLSRRPSDTSREDRRSRAGSHSRDLTIPTGPPPAGRKKLQLMPRTKPTPSMPVNKRNANQPSAPQTVVPAPGRQENESFPQAKGSGAPRKGNSAGADRVNRNDRDAEKFDKVERRDRGGKASEEPASKWTNSKETNISRQSSQPTSKKEDETKRPVLLNTFAALELNDSDA